MSYQKLSRAVALLVHRKGPQAAMKELGDHMVDIISAVAAEVPEATGFTLTYPDGWVVDVYHRSAVGNPNSVTVEVKQ